MKYGIYFVLVIALLGAGFFPAATITYAQEPGDSYTSVVPFEVPADWSVYQDVNGAWSLKHPSNWTVSESSPGKVTFEFDTPNFVEIVVEEEASPFPYDDWLSLDLLGQEVAQGLQGDPSTKMMETGRWFRGVFGLFFAMETMEPETGMMVPFVIVMTPFGDNQSVTATFTTFDSDIKNTVGAVLSSMTPGSAPAAGQQSSGDTGLLDQPTAPAETGVGVLRAGGPAFGPIVFAEVIDAQGLPINPANNFPPGVTAVHAIFDYSGMENGMEYIASWYVNGTMVLADTYTWDLGPQGSGAPVPLSNPGGFPEGEYKLELSVGGKVLQQGTFTVGGTTGPPEPVLLPTTVPQLQPTQMSMLATPVPLMQPTLASPLATPALLPTLASPLATPALLLTLASPLATPALLPTAAPLVATPALIPSPVPLMTVPLIPDTPVPPPPAPEPQGRSGQGKIVYTQFDGDVPSLWVMNVDGSGQVKIKDADHASDPSWDPSGTSIVFVGWDGNPRGASGIYSMNPDGSNVEQVWNEGSASYMDWSLPGQYVALTSIVAGTDNRRLIVYDKQAGQWLDIGPGEQGSFSPDANRLVAKSCVGGDCGLYIMNRDGSNKWRLTMDGNDSMAAWSPQGNRIAYASERGGNWDIWMVNADGSGDTRLTQDPGIDAMPAWLPDGSGIVYRSSAGGSWGIWIVNPDGTNATRLIDSFAGNDWGRARLDVR